MSRETWHRLSDLLIAQHQVVATRQVVELGFSRATFGRHVRTYAWMQLFRGCWAAPGSRDTHEQALTAASLATFDKAIFTGATALHLIGALARRPDRVHVLGSPDRHLDPRGGLCWHRAARRDGDRDRLVNGFRCADVLRAVTDLSRESSIGELERVVTALDRLREATPGEVANYVKDSGGFHGAPVFRAALARFDVELSHSGDERKARALIRLAGLPAPYRRPYTVEHDGVLIGEIDLAWLPVRYGVEIDGPTHLLPQAVARDKIRDRNLNRLLWVIDRFSTEEVQRNPKGFVDQVRAGLAAAAARGVAPWPG